jgi:hypothetical protein
MAIGITLTEPTNSAVAIMALAITGAVYHTSTGLCVVTHTNAFGQSAVKHIYGQQGADLYNALVSIKAGTYTSTT